MPYAAPPTGLDGVRPKGLFEVDWLDPFRLVAVVDGNQFIARQAYLVINAATTGTIDEYGPVLADVMQKVCLHYALAYEAVKLHLDRQELWKGQLGPWELAFCMIRTRILCSRAGVGRPAIDRITQTLGPPASVAPQALHRVDA
jgi:hypothetical protein